MLRRLLVAGLVVSSGLAGAASTRSDAGPPPAAADAVLAFTFDGGVASLTALDPNTLRPQGAALDVRGCTFGWSFSPDRARLVAGDNDGRVRFVGTAPARTLGEIQTKANAPMAASAWLGDRVLGVWHSPRGMDVRVIDPEAPRVLRVRSLAGSLQSAARTPSAFVLLLGPRAGIGPARLAVLDASGHARLVQLARIRAGQVPFDHSRLAVVKHARPGLAVDPAGNRVFVVGAQAPVAEVDLAKLSVTYHAPARGAAWLGPDAAAKGAPDGPDRYARWLGDGRLAVYGSDAHGSLVRGNLQMRTTSAGVRIVDTSTWRTTALDARASALAVAGGRLLATASNWDSRTRLEWGVGLVAYERDGTPRFHLFGDDSVYVQAAGDRALAFRGGPPRYAVVDITTGRVLDEVAGGFVPLLLDGDASAWVL
jgi:hypothetical protein